MYVHIWVEIGIFMQFNIIATALANTQQCYKCVQYANELPQAAPCTSFPQCVYTVYISLYKVPSVTWRRSEHSGWNISNIFSPFLAWYRGTFYRISVMSTCTYIITHNWAQFKVYSSSLRLKVHPLLSPLHIIDSPLMYTSLTFRVGTLRLLRVFADTASCRRKWRTMEEGILLNVVNGLKQSLLRCVYCVLSVHRRV